MSKLNLVMATAIVGFMFGFATDASATQLVFTGQNAGLFPGANPADTTQLMESVTRPSAPATPSSTTGQLVADSIIGTLASKITDAIFASTSGQSGTYSLGDGGLLHFANNGDGTITVTITEGGTTTTVTVPSS